MPGLFDYAWTANRLVGASPGAFAVLKRLYDRYQGAPDRQLAEILKAGPQPDWPAPDRGRVLFFSPRYWPAHVSWQLVIAYCLRAEGYAPEFVGCGGGGRVCDMYPVEMKSGGFCTYCRTSLGRLLKPSGFPYRVLDDFIDADAIRHGASEQVRSLSLRQCRDFMDGDIPLGRLLEPSMARSLRQVAFEADGATERLYRGFLTTAIVNLRAIEKMLEQDYRCAFMLNGKLLAESMLCQLAERAGLDFVTYERGFRTGSLFFAVNDQVTNFDVSRHYEQVREVPLSVAEEERLRKYEAVRRVGKEAIIQYFPQIEEDAKAIVAQFGIDTNKPVAVVYPNIVWDTAVFGHERAFSSIWEWIRTTIEAYRELDDWELILRIHPAEVRLPSRTRESMLTLIETHFGELPGHMHIIPPTDKASSYVLMDLAQRVLVYSSTMGLEAAMQGKEVVTAALSHYAELGFTRDAASPEQYLEMLRSAPTPDTSAMRDGARRYANMFFYRFHVPVNSVTERHLSKPEYRFTSLSELLSGDYPEVEFVRHSLLDGGQGCRLLPEPTPA